MQQITAALLCSALAALEIGGGAFALGLAAPRSNGTAKTKCHGCGHACDAQCNCGVCKTDRCMSESLCKHPPSTLALPHDARGRFSSSAGVGQSLQQ